MKLIDGWRRAWRLWSVRVAALGILTQTLQLIDPTGVLGIWNLMPLEVRALIPGRLALWIGLALFAGVIGSRLVHQMENSDGA